MQYELNIFNEANYNIEEFFSKLDEIVQTTIEKITLKHKIMFSLHIVNENEMINLNKTYRNKNYLADVLSFPLEEFFIKKTEDTLFYQDKEDIIDLGDIYVCYEKAQAQAIAYDHSLLRELSFLFLHGFLHILGYDHETKADEKIMFDLQQTILKTVNITRI